MDNTTYKLTDGTEISWEDLRRRHPMMQESEATTDMCHGHVYQSRAYYVYDPEEGTVVLDAQQEPDTRYRMVATSESSWGA